MGLWAGPPALDVQELETRVEVLNSRFQVGATVSCGAVPDLHAAQCLGPKRRSWGDASTAYEGRYVRPIGASAAC
jgi:hypothetical protein